MQLIRSSPRLGSRVGKRERHASVALVRAFRTRILHASLFSIAVTIAGTVAPCLAYDAQELSQSPARDASASRATVRDQDLGRITGRVLDASEARPLQRAHVLITPLDWSGSLRTLADHEGHFEFDALPDGRYLITAAKPGFVSVRYGQRRPFDQGTPIRVGRSQHVRGIDLRLPRGSVIAGRLFDEDGGPLRRAIVNAIRDIHIDGQRRLMPVGTDQTDDRGEYRIWDLSPGKYYVSAQVRVDVPSGTTRFGDAETSAGFTSRHSNVISAGDARAYVPAYYPGVTSVNAASVVFLGVGDEVQGIDFPVPLVQVGRVMGHVTNADGSLPGRGNILLTSESSIERGQFGVTFGAQIQADGTFTVRNVPPDRYVLSARAEGVTGPQMATVPATVTSGDVVDISVTLSPPATIRGRVALVGKQPSSGAMDVFLTVVPLDGQSGPVPQARTDSNSRFVISAIPQGHSLIRVMSSGGAWSVQSVVIDGRDVTDLSIELKSGQSVEAIVTLTDRVTEINGTINNKRGDPQTQYTVLVFSKDESFWGSHATRVKTTRPDQTGAFTVRGLPAGEYYVAVIEEQEDGEWFDGRYLEEHRIGATLVTLVGGEAKTQTFVIDR
jgi:hypothetical protein